MWKSPNGTIRAILDGTVFRAPIVVKGIEPCVKNWKKPITIARHAYGDVYKNTEIKVPGPGKVELVYTGDDGTQIKELVHKYDGPGVAQGIHNLCGSIESFARSCFNYALDTKQDLWFATKDTISKKYDHTFKDIFQEIFDAEYKEKFDEAGIEYYFVYMTGLAGKDKGYKNAVNSAKVFSKVNPRFVHVDSLTLFEGTELYDMARAGTFIPAGEKERLEELKVFIKNLHIRTHLFANTVSNFYPVTAYLPRDKENILSELQYILDTVSEEEMLEYRHNLKSLG